MASFSKILLSASTDGQRILIAGTDLASADTIHTAHATDTDEVWLYAYNGHTSVVNLTIVWGTGSFTWPVEAANGLLLVCPGIIIENAQVVKGYASETNKINVFGYVNRITL